MSNIPSRQNWCFNNLLLENKLDITQIIENFEKRMFNILQSIIDFENLPEEIPERDFKFFLQTKGETYGVKLSNGKFLINRDASASELDEYYHPTKYILTNPYVKDLKPYYTVGKDIAVIHNDSMHMGFYNIVHQYGVMIANIYMTMLNITQIERAPYVLTTSDAKTKEFFENFIKSLKDGELGVMSDGKLANLMDDKAVKSIMFGVNPTGTLKELIELENYLESSLLMEIGLNSNYNMKREYVNSSENQIDILTLIPRIDDMLKSIQKGLDEFNTLFGTNIKVKLGKSWKAIKNDALSNEEENDKIIETENGGENHETNGNN